MEVDGALLKPRRDVDLFNAQFYVKKIKATVRTRICVLQIRRSSEESVEPEAWVNAFLGRIFWDFLGEKYWANVVSKKIQMKLSKIRVGTGTSLHEYTPTV